LRTPETLSGAHLLHCNIISFTDCSPRQALDAKQHRAPSPTAFDDFDNSTDTIVLDPELERIAKAVNTQPTQNSSIPNLSGDNEERIVIHVQWQSHPLDPLPKELEWSYRMRVVRMCSIPALWAI
jgi:hypothetical protein